MTTMTETSLEQFNARAEELSKIYKADPARFVSERAAIDRAQATLDEAKQDAAAIIARRKAHTGKIDAAYHAGALNDWEQGKILERYTTEYATPNIDEAQQTLEATWDSFWNALKKAERRALQEPQPAA